MRKFEKFKTITNFAFIDENTKKEIRRKLLKAVSIPGYQVPYSSPEMPIARGWGTGGLHVTLAIIGKSDILKVIDQGSDASVNACNLRLFIQNSTGCETTFDTKEASIIQSRHRIPEEQTREDQIIVLQVPIPEILREVEASEELTRQMHSESDYAKMWVSLYEAYVKYGAIMHGAGYPVKVHHRYLMTPSPIPRWDVPLLNMNDSLILLGAGREKRLFAIPPFTKVEPLEFEDVKFHPEKFGDKQCAHTNAKEIFLDEIYVHDQESPIHLTNDSNYLDKLSHGERPQQKDHKYRGSNND